MDDLLTIKEAAAQMKVADRTIRRWIAEGRLDASKIARTVRIRRTALEALTEVQTPDKDTAAQISPVPQADRATEQPPLQSSQLPQAPYTPPPPTPQASTKPPPDLQTILSILRQKLPFLRTHYDVHLLGVFGAYRRGEQTSTSSLDLLVAFREVPGLLKYLELEHYLSDQVGVSVELVMGDALKNRGGEPAQQEVTLV